MADITITCNKLRESTDNLQSMIWDIFAVEDPHVIQETFKAYLAQAFETPDSYDSFSLALGLEMEITFSREPLRDLLEQIALLPDTPPDIDELEKTLEKGKPTINRLKKVLDPFMLNRALALQALSRGIRHDLVCFNCISREYDDYLEQGEI